MGNNQPAAAAHKHMMKKWLIPVICVLPIAGVVLWFIAGKNLGNMATIGLVLACPLSHVFLMKHDHNDPKGAEHRHG